MQRYFVDKRGGCIAVRDRKNTNPEDQGLHPDTPGVIRFWMGIDLQRFGSRKSWTVAPCDVDAAHALCDSLNNQCVKYVIYDGRAEHQPTYDCAVYVSCDSLEEAREYIDGEYGFDDGCVFAYDVVDGVAKNERRVSL